MGVQYPGTKRGCRRAECSFKPDVEQGQVQIGMFVLSLASAVGDSTGVGRAHAADTAHGPGGIQGPGGTGKAMGNTQGQPYVW